MRATDKLVKARGECFNTAVMQMFTDLKPPFVFRLLPFENPKQNKKNIGAASGRVGFCNQHVGL